MPAPRFLIINILTNSDPAAVVQLATDVANAATPPAVTVIQVEVLRDRQGTPLKIKMYFSSNANQQDVTAARSALLATDFTDVVAGFPDIVLDRDFEDMAQDEQLTTGLAPVSVPKFAGPDGEIWLVNIGDSGTGSDPVVEGAHAGEAISGTGALRVRDKDNVASLVRQAAQANYDFVAASNVIAQIGAFDVEFDAKILSTINTVAAVEGDLTADYFVQVSDTTSVYRLTSNLSLGANWWVTYSLGFGSGTIDTGIAKTAAINVKFINDNAGSTTLLVNGSPHTIFNPSPFISNSPRIVLAQRVSHRWAATGVRLSKGLLIDNLKMTVNSDGL